MPVGEGVSLVTRTARLLLMSNLDNVFKIIHVEFSLYEHCSYPAIMWYDGQAYMQQQHDTYVSVSSCEPDNVVREETSAGVQGSNPPIQFEDLEDGELPEWVTRT